jgi:hypothetical protein
LSKPSVKQHLAALRMVFDWLVVEEYTAMAGIAAETDGPLFRTTGRSTGTPHRMTQQDAYRMIERHAKRAGIKTRIGNHTLALPASPTT